MAHERCTGQVPIVQAELQLDKISRLAISLKSMNHKGHEGSRRKSLEKGLRVPSRPSWFTVFVVASSNLRTAQMRDGPLHTRL